MSIPRNCLALLLILSPAVQADYDQQYQACLDASAMINNASVAGCAEGVSETVKKEMNRIYQQLFLKLQESARKMPSNWKRRRRPGWSTAMASASCRASMSARRCITIARCR